MPSCANGAMVSTERPYSATSWPAIVNSTAAAAPPLPAPMTASFMTTPALAAEPCAQRAQTFGSGFDVRRGEAVGDVGAVGLQQLARPLRINDAAALDRDAVFILELLVPEDRFRLSHTLRQVERDTVRIHLNRVAARTPVRTRHVTAPLALAGERQQDGNGARRGDQIEIAVRQLDVAGHVIDIRNLVVTDPGADRRAFALRAGLAPFDNMTMMAEHAQVLALRART